jgi:hypothetical protein
LAKDDSTQESNSLSSRKQYKLNVVLGRPTRWNREGETEDPAMGSVLLSDKIKTTRKTILLVLSLLSYLFVLPLQARTSFFEQPRKITQRITIEGDAQQYDLVHPIHIAADASLTLRNCILTNVTSDLLCLMATSSRLVLDNTVLILSEDYSFRQGIIEIKNMSEFRGPYTWNHVGSRPLTVEKKSHRQRLIIKKDSTLLCSENLLYYYSPTSCRKDGIQFADASSTLMLHSAHIRAGRMGLLLRKGALCIHGLCTAHADNPDPRFGISLGTGQSTSDNVQLVLASPRARLRVSQPHLCHKTRTQHLVWRIATYCALAGVGIGLGALSYT